MYDRQNDVQHHRVIVALDQRRDLRLEIEGTRAAQVVHLPRAVLERQLNVVEPRRFSAPTRDSFRPTPDVMRLM